MTEKEKRGYFLLESKGVVRLFLLSGITEYITIGLIFLHGIIFIPAEVAAFL